MKINFVATSYPRSDTDWQGIFIKYMHFSLADNITPDISYWHPQGTTPTNSKCYCSKTDQAFLTKMTKHGGVAHLLRNQPIKGIFYATDLVWRMWRANKRSREVDIFHINWIQNSLALFGINKPAVITALGTDLILLQNPVIRFATKAILQNKKVVIAPNSTWMANAINKQLGNGIKIKPVPFGIDDKWYAVSRCPERITNSWLIVTRITKNKIGPVFSWAKKHFSEISPLLIIGPMQEHLKLPAWVRLIGTATPDELCADWFPTIKGLITLSQHSEGLPQTILEAMAAGVPIIASDQPAHRNAIEHNKSGMIVKTETEFDQAIEFLSDDKNNTLIGKDARNSVRVSYGTWKECAMRYDALYRELLAT